MCLELQNADLDMDFKNIHLSNYSKVQGILQSFYISTYKDIVKIDKNYTKLSYI